MSKKYISIKEFATNVGISVQAVYKRIKNSNDKIQPYLNRVNGKVYIDISAVDELYKGERLNLELNQVEGTNNLLKEDEQKNFSQVISILNQQIIAYRKELEVKDKQLEVKDKQIADLTEIVKQHSKALDQQQQLNLIDKNKLLQLESAEAKNEKKGFNWFKKNK